VGMGDEDELFDPTLFLNKSYVQKTLSFGPYQLLVELLDSAATDFDLTGQIIWPAAAVLCQFAMKEREMFRGKAVLEVGAGVGISGLLASHFAESVVLSDANEVILDLLRRNIAQNARENCSCWKLDWAVTDDLLEISSKFSNGFDIIIGSDVVYWRESILPLFTTIHKLLSHREQSRVIICYQSRAKNTDDFLLSTSESMGFLIDNIALESFMDGEGEQITRLEHVRLYVLKRKSKEQ